MEAIKEIKTDTWSGAFVNSECPPYRSTPLDHYQYSKYDNEYRFSQLYEYEYLYKEVMIYTVLRFEPISVKRHCEAALIGMIDAMKAVGEFKL